MPGKKQPNPKRSPLTRLWDKISHRWDRHTNVYFISGMCYNCSIFDNIRLPKGFRKIYLEWNIPAPGESLSDYTCRMAEVIDRSRPYVLVGYSFGAVIIQEMNRLLDPKKSIVISSFKSIEEIPALFRAVRVSNLTERIPLSVFSSSEFITEAFNRLIYHMPTSELAAFMTVLDPVYVKWAVKQITDWIPASHDIKHLYHIHGTLDQIFPFDNIKGAFPVEGGDHLMVWKKADVVSLLLGGILMMKEE